ncbi:hypothetical protein U1Q18_026106, partial [Sarracenia purpurea var. burkii]
RARLSLEDKAIPTTISDQGELRYKYITGCKIELAKSEPEELQRRKTTTASRRCCLCRRPPLLPSPPNPGEYQESLHTVNLAARSRHISNFVSSAHKSDTPNIKIDMEATSDIHHIARGV